MEEERVKKGKKGIIFAVLLALIFVSIFVWNLVQFLEKGDQEREVKEEIPVQTVVSELMDLTWVIEQTGNIKPNVEVNVHPKVPGKIIRELVVEKGDFVKRGDLIAALEDEAIKAQIEETMAALDSAKANLKQVEAKLEMIEKDRGRLESLYEEKAVSKQKLEHAQAEYDATEQAQKLAMSEIRRIEAVLKRLRIAFRDHKVHAPVTGYISARYADKGSMSAVQNPIVRISNDEVVKVVTGITEKDFPRIKKGMKVKISVDAFPHKVFQGDVSVISPTIDPFTRTGEIEIHIPNHNLMLRSGMFAHMKVLLGKKRVLAVPRHALNRLPGTGSYYVYVVNGHRAILTNVKVGITQGNNTEISEGLQVGEEVVVRGQNRLKDGMDVVVETMGSQESKDREQGR